MLTWSDVNGVQREQYGNMIGLGYYRNKLLHWFNTEGALACAFHALQDSGSVRASSEPASSPPSDSAAGADRDELLDSALFLHDMLRMEFVRPDDADDRAQLAQALASMQERGVLVGSSSSRVEAGDATTLSLLSTLIWPFIDSYWVTITSLFALRRPAGAVTRDDLLKRVQWLAETMYHERLIGFYESCSLETLQNAVAQLHTWGVLETHTPASSGSRRSRRAASSKSLLRLTPRFEREGELETLAMRVAKLRKLPPSVALGGLAAAGLGAAQGSASAAGRESQLIAHLPALSKM